jgi:hypothetical protein
MEISESESEAHEGYCEKCHSERLERMFPVYWARGRGTFAIPSPAALRKEKLDTRKTVIALGTIILVVALVLAAYSALSDFANWVFQTQNVLLFLYEGSLLTLLGILLTLLGTTLKKKKQR